MSAASVMARWVSGRATVLMFLSVILGLTVQDLARLLSPLVL